MKRGLLILVVVAALLPFAQQAEAVPSFARQTNMACQGCHTAYPLLNAVGREFKKNGYTVPGATFQPGAFPVGARVVGRVADNKRDSGPTKIDSLHELELFYAGPVADNISVFAEVEAEDGDDFAMGLKHAVVNYRHSDAFNLQVGRASVFFSDPYDTLSDGRRLTAEHKPMLNARKRASTGGTENRHRLRDALQQVNVNGQVGPVWYMVGISGGGATADSGKVGADPDDYQARLALDLFGGSAMVGAFYYGGTDTISSSTTALTVGGTGVFGDPIISTTTTSVVKDDFTAYGFDLRHDCDTLGLTVLAAAAWTTDDYADSATDVEVASGYLQLLRPFDVGGRQLVPLVRYNWADTDGSANDRASDDALRMTTAQLSYYVRENARVTTEFTNFDSVVNNQRFIVGFDVAF